MTDQGSRATVNRGSPQTRMTHRLPLAPFAARAAMMALVAALPAVGAIAADVPTPPASDAVPVIAGGGPLSTTDSDGDIVVTGQRERGEIISAVPPDTVLTPEDIASYGASNIGDLVTALSARTASGRGRGSGAPVVLVNGRRVSGFNEIRNIPPEAIARVEIFPEEAALDYGYAPDQRVVNFVLRDQFSSRRVEAQLGGSGEGGRATRGGEASYVRIAGRARINASAEYQHQTPLTEDERGIIEATSALPLTSAGVISAPGGGPIDPALSAIAGYPVTLTGVPAGGGSLAAFATTPIGQSVDQGRYRTLLGGSDTLTLDATVATPFGHRGDGGSLNLRYDRATSRSLLGIAQATTLIDPSNPASPFDDPVLLTRVYDSASPLIGTSQSDTFHAGASADGRFGKWRWTTTANADSASTRTTTDRGIDGLALQALVDAGANPFVTDDASFAPRRDADWTRQLSQSGDGNVVLNGPLFSLPAGAVRMTVQGGYAHQSLTATSQRLGVVTPTDLARDQWNGSANVDLPITDRDRGVLGAIGTLSANGRYAWTSTGGFGSLYGYTLGFNWQPREPLSLIATWVGDDSAPGLTQLGAPTQVTPGQPIFDYVRNQSVIASIITGGNPALRPERKRDFRASATWRPIPDTDLTLTATYARTISHDTTAAFPELTPEIEAAFPGRVTRGVDGSIISVDQRPVNFAETHGRQIRYGIAYAKSFGRRSGEGGPDGARGPGGRRGPGGPGGFGGGRGGNGGRWNVAIYHTVQLQDDVLIAPGIPLLDLLHGSATSATGGSPRHIVEFDGGWFRQGIGLRFNGTWRDGTTVNGALTGANATTLHFSPQMTVNLRAFIDFDRRPGWTEAVPLLKHGRLMLRVNNLFNDRIAVRDDNGVTPLRYQPAYLDPAGRTIMAEYALRF